MRVVTRSGTVRKIDRSGTQLPLDRIPVPEAGHVPVWSKERPIVA